MIDRTDIKLGKLAPKHDSRTLWFDSYIDKPKLPKIPKSYGYSRGIRYWGMMGNDKIGDCTAAMEAHAVMCWTNATSKFYIPTDKEVVDFYSSVTGYNGTEASDTGAALLDVEKAMRNIGLGGHRQGAFTAIQPKNIDHIKLALYIFGCVKIGVQLPDTCFDQAVWHIPTNPGWSDLPNPNSGHAILLTDYDQKFVKVITWGEPKYATWEWIEACMDEGYVGLSKDFLMGKKSPAGFDIANLNADLKLI